MKSNEIGNSRHAAPRYAQFVSAACFGFLVTSCGESPEVNPNQGAQDTLVQPFDSESSDSDQVQQASIPVILVVMDALDADHISHLGYERDTTPHLDAFAQDSISFREAFSPAPYTVAGIGSILTGRRPDTTGLFTKLNMLGDDEVPLAEVLKQRGYHTRALVGNPNGGMRYGVLRGFDEVSTLYVAEEGAEPNFVTRNGTEVHLPQAKEHLPLMIEFLDRLPVEDGAPEPFFFYSHMLEPHSPYVADEPFRSKYIDPDYEGVFLKGDTDDLLDTVYGRKQTNAEDRAAITALYDGHLASADHAFGDLMAELKARGLYDKSLIIMTSDHGEAMFQHGRWGHNDHIYDEMIHVPLIVKMPGSEGPRGKILNSLISTMDVLPTICEILNIAPGDLPLDGVSLFDTVISGEEQEAGRSLFLRTHHEKPDVGIRTAKDKAIMMRGGSGEKRFEFYDLVRDADEASSIMKMQSDPVREAVAQIKAELARVVATRRAVAQDRRAHEDSNLLGPLGYTDEVEHANTGVSAPPKESEEDQVDDHE